MKIGFATDHGGYILKEPILKALRDSGHAVRDFGAYNLVPEDDYPDFVIPPAKAVGQGEVERGIAICGSGVDSGIWAVYDTPQLGLGTVRLGLCAGVVPRERPRKLPAHRIFDPTQAPLLAKKSPDLIV